MHSDGLNTTGLPASNAVWEQRFGADGYLYGTEPNEFLRGHVGSFPRGRVLCVAEGEGRNAVFLASQGFEVSSIDLTEAGVAKTRRLAKQRGVTVDAVTGDLATADLGIQSWNGIVSIFAHLPPRFVEISTGESWMRWPPAGSSCLRRIRRTRSDAVPADRPHRSWR